MSYARLSEGDVYVYDHVYMGLRCETCDHVTGENKFAMLVHLVQEHVNKGQTVPNRALARLAIEAVKQGTDDNGMIVLWWDTRAFPDYKNVPVTALVREAANDHNDWGVAQKIGAVLQKTIVDADYLSDDVGRTWVRRT